MSRGVSASSEFVSSGLSCLKQKHKSMNKIISKMRGFWKKVLSQQSWRAGIYGKNKTCSKKAAGNLGGHPNIPQHIQSLIFFKTILE